MGKGMLDEETSSIPDLAAGVEVKDGMVRLPDASTLFVFSLAWGAFGIGKSPCRSPLPLSPAQVSKEDFDQAVRGAQEALRAKTTSSQMMLQQASSAMRNAVTALSLSEQEVANLRAVVKELQERPGEGGGDFGDRERAQLRAAQARVAELSANFRNLQSEVARMEYERDGADMPVATRFPIRIDPALSSKVVCIAQVVMLGYAYGDAENAIDAVRVNDAALAVEWLEARNVAKIQMLAPTELRARAIGAGATTTRQTAVGAETTTTTRHVTPPALSTPAPALSTPAPALSTPAPALSPRRSIAGVVPETDEARALGGLSRGARTKTGRDASELYAARKRAVMTLAILAVHPPPTMGKSDRDSMSIRALVALSKLARGDRAFMVMMLGGARCGTDCLNLFAGDVTVAIAVFDMFQGFASNPSTMMKLRRQQRFKHMPKTICKAVYLNSTVMDVCGSAAHALWSMASIGGRETQDRIVSAGALDFIKDSLCRPKSDDPDGINNKKLIGCLLALATANPRMQDLLVETRMRALIRKGLFEHQHISFRGEFASLRDWTKAEFDNPGPLPDGVTVDTSTGRAKSPATATATATSSSYHHTIQTGRAEMAHSRPQPERGAVHASTGRAKSSAEAEAEAEAANAKTASATEGASKRETSSSYHHTTRTEVRSSVVVKKNGVVVETTRKKALRPGVTPEMMYAAKKRAITMLSAVAVNPPGKIAGVTPAQSEEIARRSLEALAKLAVGDSAYLVLTLGGPRATIDCLRLYPENASIATAAFGVLRGLLQNPSTMMKIRKQKRFRIIPATVVDAVHRHRTLDVKAEAAHVFWTYAGVGGSDAQHAVLAAEFLDPLKSAMEEVRVVDTGGSDARARKLVGCVLSLAMHNSDVQDRLVREGLRGLVRKILVQFSTISFYGEFFELRDWIRGDRGGAKSIPRGGPRDESAARREKNVAETTLGKGAEHASPDGRSPSHAEAARLAVKFSAEEIDGAFASPARTAAEVNEERDAFDGVDRMRRIVDDATPGKHRERRATRDVRGLRDSAAYVPASGAGAWTVERALKTLASDRVAEHADASEALAEMFAASPATGVEIVMKGGVRAITGAIAAGNAAFAAGGLALLHMFASAETTSRRVKADAGVVAGETPGAVLGVMRRYSRNSAVQQWGAMTLWALARDNARCKRATLGTKVPGGRGVAAEILANALKNHGGESEGVGKALAGCVLALAVNDVDWQRTWVEMGVPALVMRTMETHPGLTFKGEFDSLRDWLRAHSR